MSLVALLNNKIQEQVTSDRRGSIDYSHLQERKILKFNSSSIALMTIPSAATTEFSTGSIQTHIASSTGYTDPYCFVYWVTQENIAPVARPI